jgi:NADH:ubiquinone oxidoreductase subunit E/NAD-dependent dihydropyrimidine dehydrogenase PreA subunit
MNPQDRPAVTTDNKKPCGAVMVCGGGIAGIQASLDLSAAGFRVYLVEESPSIGGGMARLDKTFPTGDCATCIISPKLVECIRDLNIDIFTMAEVVRIDGEAGDFTVTVRQRPRYVDLGKCTGCGDCWQACPVRNIPETPEPFEPSQPLDDEDRARLDEILARYQGERGALMPVLQDINETYGYLPRLLLEHVNVGLGIPLAAILRVASFYDEFRLEPLARHTVEVCEGTSCHAMGSRLLREKLEEEIAVRNEEDGGSSAGNGPLKRFALRTVRCLGLCALSPAMRIDGQAFGKVGLEKVPGILERFE